MLEMPKYNHETNITNTKGLREDIHNNLFRKLNKKRKYFQNEKQFRKYLTRTFYCF